MTTARKSAPPIQPQYIRHRKLADDLAQRIKQLIQETPLPSGSRLPSIAELARDYGVGAPTVREALKRLEIAGVVSIRHGSGVYVALQGDALVITNPVYDAPVSKKVLLDLIEARMPIEVASAGLAAELATGDDLAGMRRLLNHAEANLGDDAILNQTNMAFHRAIAVASGNLVIGQLLEVLTGLFTREQRAILDIQNSRREDHAEHLAILDALVVHDPSLARDRMQAHLEGVRQDLQAWDPVTHPVTP